MEQADSVCESMCGRADADVWCDMRACDMICVVLWFICFICIAYVRVGKGKRGSGSEHMNGRAGRTGSMNRCAVFIRAVRG